MTASMSIDSTLVSIFSGGSLPSVEGYKTILDACSADLVELMVHPAIVDAQHREATGISGVSRLDFEVLSSLEWREFLMRRGFDVVSFGGQ